MKFKRIRRQVIFGAVVMSLSASLTPITQQTPATEPVVPIRSASVADFKGKVHIELPGQAPSNPNLGQVLPAETTITTGNGRILLRLEDGSQILVHSHTHIVLKQPSPTSWQHLQLLLGKIKAEIQKLTGGAPPFQIGTPSAVITVRGTRFYVQVNKHKTTRVDVEEGVVEVESLNHIGRPVQVRAGFSDAVKEDHAPEEPKEMHGQSGNSASHGHSSSHGKKP